MTANAPANVKRPGPARPGDWGKGSGKETPMRHLRRLLGLLFALDSDMLAAHIIAQEEPCIL